MEDLVVGVKKTADGNSVIGLGDLDSIFNNLEQAIRVIDKDYIVRRINKAFADMSGVNIEEAIGKKCWEVFPGPSCHTTECRLSRIFAGEKKISLESTRSKRNGEQIPCSIDAIPLKTDSGEVRGILEIFKDLSDSKKYEQMLKESEERYHTVVDLQAAKGEAIVMLQDIDGVPGKYAFFSEQWPRIIGYSKEELQKISAFDLLAPEYLPARIAQYNLIMSEKLQEEPFEAVLIRKNGTRMPVEIMTSAATFQGKPATVAYIRDITERKKLEQRLIDQKNRYQNLFEHSPVATWEADLSGVKKHMDALRDQGVTDLKTYLRDHPEDVLISDYYSLWKYVGVNQSAFNLSGNPHDSDTMRRDYCAVIRTNPDMYENHVFTLCAFFEGKRHFEHAVSTKFLGKPMHTLHKTSVPPGYEESLSRVFITNYDVTSLRETEKSLKDYQEKLEEKVENRTAQLKKEIILRQLEEEKSRKLYETECQLRHQLQKQMEERIEFTRALVHEIKTPLTSMLAAGELLTTQCRKDIQQQLARHLYQSACELNLRVDEMFDLTKGEMGSLRIRRTDVKLSKLFCDILESVRPQAFLKGQNLIEEIDASLPVAFVDVGRVRQVILNILNNALKFTPSGGSIVFKAGLKGDDILVCVKDSGPGISFQEQKVLFQAYQHAGKSKERFSGLGLGLAISKMLVELHGGRIWVESEEGKGSTFYFSLPLVLKET